MVHISIHMSVHMYVHMSMHMSMHRPSTIGMYTVLVLVWLFINTYMSKRFEKIDLFLNWVQILNVVGEFKLPNWPDVIQSLLNILAIFDFDVDLLSPNCVFKGWSFQADFYVQTSIPFVVAIVRPRRPVPWLAQRSRPHACFCVHMPSCVRVFCPTNKVVFACTPARLPGHTPAHTYAHARNLVGCVLGKSTYDLQRPQKGTCRPQGRRRGCGRGCGHKGRTERRNKGCG